MAAARLGISHAEFMGWPLHERSLMLALGRVERNTGRRGEWLPDATDPRADPNDYTNTLGFRPSGPHMNWADKAALDAEAQYRKDAGKDANLNGMFWTVEQV